MASDAGEIFDEHGGDAMAIAELLVWEQNTVARLRKEAEQHTAAERAWGAELERLRKENEQLREHRRRFGDIVIFTTEHVAAICAELDLSYEAETETVLAAIRKLRA